MGKRLIIHSVNPQKRFIQEVVSELEKGAVIIYPTDTVYAIGCDINSKSAFQKICQLKGINPEKSQFSFICEDLKKAGEYTLPLETALFKVMKRAFPGPYTFIVPASKAIPRHTLSKRKTIGIRVSSHPTPQAIVEALGRPLLSTSLKDEDGNYEFDPDEIFENYGKLVDLFIDGGWGGSEASTVLDFSHGSDEIVILREGMGSLSIL